MHLSPWHIYTNIPSHKMEYLSISGVDVVKTLHVLYELNRKYLVANKHHIRSNKILQKYLEDSSFLEVIYRMLPWSIRLLQLQTNNLIFHYKSLTTGVISGGCSYCETHPKIMEGCRFFFFFFQITRNYENINVLTLHETIKCINLANSNTDLH